MSKVYPKYKEVRMGNGLGLNSDPIKVAAVTAQYIPNFTTDQYLNVIPSQAILGHSSALTTKTYTLGVFSADPTSISALTGSADVVAVVLYRDTGDSTTSNLICYVDSAVGLPYTPNGSDWTVTWNASGIFQG